MSGNVESIYIVQFIYKFNSLASKSRTVISLPELLGRLHTDEFCFLENDGSLKEKLVFLVIR